MTFRTEIALPKMDRKLSYRANALMIGSCFTENIGNHLSEHLFPVLTNPCGILYNPASIAECLELITGNSQLTEQDLFFANETWNSFSFHSRFSHVRKETALEAMNKSLSRAAIHLQSSSHLFLTFGTSWVYRLKENGRISGNCHKLPSDHFTRERLSVEIMTAQWTDLLSKLYEIHPNLQVVMTVSPIRHLKDGSYENQVSKSALFLMIDQLLTRFNSPQLSYFPSYELVMDELRDYRFYDADMVHLNGVAAAFVQEKFNEVFLDRESTVIYQSMLKLIKALSHKPFQPDSLTFRDFLSKTEREINRMAELYPFVNFEKLLIDIIQKKGY
jgi:hypothetical protein